MARGREIPHMEPSASNPVDIFNRHTSGTATSHSRRLSFLSASNIVQAPLYALLEYSGLVRTRSNHQDTDTFINGSPPLSSASAADISDGEVSIRIIGGAENELDREGTGLVIGHVGETICQNDISIASSMVGMHGAAPSAPVSETHPDSRTDRVAGEAVLHSTNGATDTVGGEGGGPNGRDSSYQRYDIQQAARWIEQILPFSLLLLVVFIRQHLQGFFVTIWIAAVLFKSNDILRKQTALKGERKISVLTGISIAFTLHVIGVYWWYQNDDILFPMVMLPPRAIPPFWHAVFIILVNDTMVRQAAMVIKCILLIYYKNSRGRNYRKQGQMLTLVEYLLLLYRALLPTPVWYRFFLNKDYGSLFSSLMTGLYLTFKLTSVVEKVLYRHLLRSLRRSTTTQPLTFTLLSHVQNPDPLLQVRTFAFSSAEEAAAERRRRKRRLRIEPPLNAIRAQPQHRERDPNAPRLPDTTSSLTGPRLNLHNRVQSLIRAGDLDAASTVARHSVFSSTRPTVFTCNAIIAAMYRAKRYKDAIALFHLFFNQSNIVPNVVSYNNLINTHCDEGDVDKAIEVYRHILENAPFSPSWVTYQHLTKGLVNAGRVDEGVDLLREMLNKGGGADSLVYNNLISGFLELGNFEKANELFDELKERCLVYNGVVSATFMEWYFKQGKDKEAMESYRSWLAREFTTVPATCNVLLEVLLKWGKEKDAWALFEKMLDDHKPPNSQAVNSDTFNIMVNECFKNLKFSEALETFKKVGTHAKSKPFAMDVAGYNNIITRFCENGMLTEAEALFDELCSKALSPDATTHKTLIDAYLKFERIDEALKILNRMVDQGLRVVASFGNSVFDELIRNGKVVECAQILSKMGEKDPKPDATCYEVVVKGLCNANLLDKACDVLDECLRHGVGFTTTLRAVVKEAFEEAGRGAEIDKLLNMSKWGYIPRQSPHRPAAHPPRGFHHQPFAPSPVTGQHFSQSPPAYTPPNSPSGPSPGMTGLHASQLPPSWGQYNSPSGSHHIQSSSQIDQPSWGPPPQMRIPHQPSPAASPQLSETYCPPSGFPTQTNGTCQPPSGPVPQTPHSAPARSQQTQWSTPSQLGSQQPQQTSWRTASQGIGQVPEQTPPQQAAPQVAAQQQTPWRNQPHQMAGQSPQQTPPQVAGQQQMHWGNPPYMAGQHQTSWGNPTHMNGEQQRSWGHPPHVSREQTSSWGNPPQLAGQHQTWRNQMAEQQPHQSPLRVPPGITGQVVHPSPWNSHTHMTGENTSRLSSPMSRSSPYHGEVQPNTPESNDPTSGTSSTYNSSEHPPMAEEVAA